ncbi:MAG: hypothetical protein K2H52_14680 [Lachnospiraceae bacterium]|nr:hypothetical protein [Lachnospiraceae bacterium]
MKAKKYFSPYLTEDFPNWWYSAPTAVFSFLEENDLSGKRWCCSVPMERVDWHPA